MSVRSYSVGVVALTIGVGRRWLDNLITRHEIPGVVRAGNGVERRISETGLVAIECARILNQELGVSLERAARIIGIAIGSGIPEELRFTTPSGLVISLPLGPLRGQLQHRVFETVDALPRSTRGRPARRRPPAT